MLCNVLAWSHWRIPTTSSFGLSMWSRSKPGQIRSCGEWASGVVAKESQRIENALTLLHHICGELENGGCPTTVMKSLDHWPDLGNDLDLYTTADERQVMHVMLNRLGAHIEAAKLGRSSGEQVEFCRTRAAGVGGSPRPATGPDGRADGNGEAIRNPPRSQDAEGPHFHGSGTRRASHRRHLAAHVSALLLSRVRHRKHRSAAGMRANWISRS